MLTYFLCVDTEDKWYWTVMETHGTDNTNWRTIARSVGTYSTRKACEEDVTLMKTLSAKARIMDFADKGVV